MRYVLKTFLGGILSVSICHLGFSSVHKFTERLLLDGAFGTSYPNINLQRIPLFGAHTGKELQQLLDDSGPIPEPTASPFYVVNVDSLNSFIYRPINSLVSFKIDLPPRIDSNRTNLSLVPRSHATESLLHVNASGCIVSEDGSRVGNLDILPTGGSKTGGIFPPTSGSESVSTSFAGFFQWMAQVSSIEFVDTCIVVYNQFGQSKTFSSDLTLFERCITCIAEAAIRGVPVSVQSGRTPARVCTRMDKGRRFAR
jgi:hypothetical protein